MITADTEQKIAEIKHELAQLELNIKDCRKSLERLVTAGDQDAIPDFVVNTEEYDGVMFSIEEFSDEIRTVYYCLNRA